jgi:hypothetical protein
MWTSQNMLFFSCTALNLRVTEVHINTFKPTGNYMYHLLQYQQLHFTHRMCIWVLFDSQREQQLLP